MKNNILRAIIIFAVVSTLSYMTWPLMILDYSSCSPNANCLGEQKEELFGGMKYVTRKKTTYDSTIGDNSIFYNQNLETVYKFNHTQAITWSILLGLLGVFALLIFNRMKMKTAFK